MAVATPVILPLVAFKLNPLTKLGIIANEIVPYPPLALTGVTSTVSINL